MGQHTEGLHSCCFPPTFRPWSTKNIIFQLLTTWIFCLQCFHLSFVTQSGYDYFQTINQLTSVGRKWNRCYVKSSVYTCIQFAYIVVQHWKIIESKHQFCTSHIWEPKHLSAQDLNQSWQNNQTCEGRFPMIIHRFNLGLGIIVKMKENLVKGWRKGKQMIHNSTGSSQIRDITTVW